MITIESTGNGYKMKFSSGIRGVRSLVVKASDVAEVHKAIDHYIGEHGGKRHGSCPLCRSMTQQELADRKGASRTR